MKFFTTPQLKRWLIPLLLFSGILAVYLGNQNVIHVSDSQWTTYVGLSLLHESNPNLNEYEEILARKDFFGVARVDGQYLYKFPIGSAFVAAPVLWAIDLVLPIDLFSYFQENQNRFTSQIELFIASLVTAVTAVFLYLIARYYLPKRNAFFSGSHILASPLR